MAFDGVLPPESLSFAERASISRSLACHNTPERLLDGFPSQGPQVPPPVGKPEWRFAQRSCGRYSVRASRPDRATKIQGNLFFRGGHNEGRTPSGYP